MEDSRNFGGYEITRADVDACKAKLKKSDCPDVEYFVLTAEDDQWFEQAFIEKAEAAGDEEVLEAYAQWLSAERYMMMAI